MKNKELKVGLFAAIALGLLYLGFNFLKGKDFFEHKKKYYAVYDNINQLTKSNPVLVNGYAVGRVSKTRLLQQKNNRVLVELEIDADITLTRDTKAILNSEFLGSKYLLLEIGKSPVKLKQGDTLITEVAKGMFDVLSETAEPVASDLQTTLRKFNTALDDLGQFFKKLDIIVTKLQTTPDLLNKTLVTTNGRIDELAVSLKTDAEKTATLLDEMRPVIANLKIASDSLKRLQLNQTLHKVNLTIASLNESLGKLKKRDNTMGRLLTEDSLYVNLNKLLISLDKLSEHINTNPKHFFAPLGKSRSKVERDLKKLEEEKKKSAAKK